MVPSHAVGFLHAPTALPGGLALRSLSSTASPARPLSLRAPKMTASGGRDAIEERWFVEHFTRRSMLLSSLFVAASLVAGGGAPAAQATEVDFIDGILVSAVPTEDVLRKRAQAGLKGVLNLMPMDEARENGLGAFAEKEEFIVKSLGMAYAQIDVPQNGPYSEELKLRVRKQVAALPKPLMVHCRSGLRSRLIVLDTDTVEFLKNAPPPPTPTAEDDDDE